MGTLIIMGHGRINETETMHVPAGSQVHFFAPPGFAIDKGFAGEIAQSQRQPATIYYAGQALKRHYLCPSLDFEMAARFLKVKDRPNKADTWVVQLKNHASHGSGHGGSCMGLDELIQYFQGLGLTGGTLTVHWALWQK